MIRMVELPSGNWLNLDEIESIQERGTSTEIWTKSRRCFTIDDQNPATVRYNLSTGWKVLEF